MSYRLIVVVAALVAALLAITIFALAAVVAYLRNMRTFDAKTTLIGDAGRGKMVFDGKGDCARCHVEPVIGKMGKDLFTAACGICHEGEHRATMVPDLHALPHETNAEFWKTWTAHGKIGSLMPAFAQTDGGPLSDQQIASLTDYLVKAIPSKPGATAAILPTTTAAH